MQVTTRKPLDEQEIREAHGHFIDDFDAKILDIPNVECEMCHNLFCKSDISMMVIHEDRDTGRPRRQVAQSTHKMKVRFTNEVDTDKRKYETAIHEVSNITDCN